MELGRKIDWRAVSTWVLGFGSISYLGLNGGGYDPLVHDQIGIVVWWVLLVTVLVGALPRCRLGTSAWCALALLAAFAAWTALSLNWTESSERTFADVARVTTYLGIFALALFVRGPKGAHRMVAAVGTGIAFVTITALLSRLHPAWFSGAGQTAKFLSSGQERLSYPLNYWNGLAALIAIGFPLVLHTATCAKSVPPRALAAAALPAMALTIFFTLSRGGIAAAVVALAVFMALTSDRLPKLLTLLIAGVGGAILIAGVIQRNALRHGLLNATSHHQGNEMLAMVIVVCAGVGLTQAGISLALFNEMRPRWAFVTRRQSLMFALAAMLSVVIVAGALDASGRASHAWTDFKQSNGQPGKGTERLSSVAGESRYQFWSAAVREARSKPLTGTGSGTFRYWWTRNGDVPASVIDTHSLYLQTLGELGIVGLALIVVFLLTVLLGGGRNILRAGQRGRPQLAAALGGCIAFCLIAAFDWVWQIPVLPVALLLLASGLVTAGMRSKQGETPGLRLWRRAVFVVAAVTAIVVIAIPLSSSTLVRQSQADARAGNLAAALEAARSAQSAQPDAATPRLQEALLLETQGHLRLAAAAAHDATERESTNWETWLVLSRVEAKQGRVSAAVRAYRKAKSLDPLSPLFAR